MDFSAQLSANALTRYSRQLILPTWSFEKQQKLAQSRLLIESDFNLGILYASAAGIGRIEFIGALNQNFASHLRVFNPEVNIVNYSRNSSDFNFLLLDSSTEVSSKAKLSYRVGKQSAHLSDNLNIKGWSIMRDIGGLKFSEESWVDFATLACISHLLEQE